jgi:hypothetical protein
MELSNPVTVLTNFTAASHLLFSESLKDTYADFRTNVLRNAEWATWHGKLLGPYPKGWCIRKANLADLETALKSFNVPFEIREYPADALELRKRTKSIKTSKKTSNKPQGLPNACAPSQIPSQPYVQKWMQWQNEQPTTRAATFGMSATHVMLNIRNDALHPDPKSYVVSLLSSEDLVHTSQGRSDLGDAYEEVARLAWDQYHLLQEELLLVKDEASTYTREDLPFKYQPIDDENDWDED